MCMFAEADTTVRDCIHRCQGLPVCPWLHCFQQRPLLRKPPTQAAQTHCPAHLPAGSFRLSGWLWMVRTCGSGHSNGVLLYC